MRTNRRRPRAALWAAGCRPDAGPVRVRAAGAGVACRAGAAARRRCKRAYDEPIPRRSATAECSQNPRWRSGLPARSVRAPRRPGEQQSCARWSGHGYGSAGSRSASPSCTGRRPWRPRHRRPRSSGTEGAPVVTASAGGPAPVPLRGPAISCPTHVWTGLPYLNRFFDESLQNGVCTHGPIYIASNTLGTLTGSAWRGVFPGGGRHHHRHPHAGRRLAVAGDRRQPPRRRRHLQRQWHRDAADLHHRRLAGSVAGHRLRRQQARWRM